ncbi:hypothetical protein POM88_034228 [Heracleum sosnowskyi]|uniref:Uncharacterized protein n=1 Tax=Heracleum sosnowskyi TaxID=360622 RepID=A0AAD8HJ41_9APIA|nr:hypothetical protein POM88_034228 [Heracleum sosnowskyi]
MGPVLVDSPVEAEFKAILFILNAVVLVLIKADCRSYFSTDEHDKLLIKQQNFSFKLISRVLNTVADSLAKQGVRCRDGKFYNLGSNNSRLVSEISSFDMDVKVCDRNCNELAIYFAEHGASNFSQMVVIEEPFGRIPNIWRLDMGLGSADARYVAIYESDLLPQVINVEPMPKDGMDGD